MNKFLISIFLILAISGFTMSSVSAKEQTYTNTMELNKCYTVNNHGGVTLWGNRLAPDTDQINMYTPSFGSDVILSTRAWGENGIIFKHCYNGLDLIADGSVEIKEYVYTTGTAGDSTYAYNVTPRKVGSFTCKTQHAQAGDKTYVFNFVDTGLKVNGGRR